VLSTASVTRTEILQRAPLLYPTTFGEVEWRRIFLNVSVALALCQISDRFFLYPGVADSLFDSMTATLPSDDRSGRLGLLCSLREFVNGMVISSTIGCRTYVSVMTRPRHILSCHLLYESLMPNSPQRMVGPRV
jgi:hypothetical protein